MSARLFRSFGGRAEQVAKAREQQRKRLRAFSARVEVLRRKVRRGIELDAEDRHILAKCGPETLKYIGYAPKVTS